MANDTQARSRSCPHVTVLNSLRSLSTDVAEGLSLSFAFSSHYTFEGSVIYPVNALAAATAGEAR